MSIPLLSAQSKEILSLCIQVQATEKRLDEARGTINMRNLDPKNDFFLADFLDEEAKLESLAQLIDVKIQCISKNQLALVVTALEAQANPPS